MGHVCAGVMASRGAVVNIYTQRPEQWGRTLSVRDGDGRVYEGTLGTVSSDPAEALDGCGTILLCLPGFAIERTLRSIRPHLTAGQRVGSIVASTGFFFFAHGILSPQTPLFGFQRVPFIARTDVYGHAANLLGYKAEMAVATEGMPDAEAFVSELSVLLGTPSRLLGHWLDASLTNSNPILHTARLHDLWSRWDGRPWAENVYFYADWTDAASETLIAMDTEFMELLGALPVTAGAVKPLLEYYESADAASLTRKLRSIAAFRSITAPMRETAEGWIPDRDSRYFTEDFPFGLRFIRDLAAENGVPTPAIDEVWNWGAGFMARNH